MNKDKYMYSWKGFDDFWSTLNPHYGLDSEVPG